MPRAIIYTMNKVNSIHFVGIKGVGMTPLAIIAKQAGIAVTGSDLPQVFITDAVLAKNEIKVFDGFSAEHVGEIDLVVVTNAHGGYDNVEVKAAKDKDIPVISQAQAVGEFMKGEILNREFVGISITGTHGKTTTSAMIASLLTTAGKDPSYVIGTASIPSLGHAGHLGKGEYFVAEADEYITEIKYDRTIKFLWQHPKVLVMTNLEHDHPDVYPDLQSVKQAFSNFIQQLYPEGLLIINGDDSNLREVSKHSKAQVTTYGLLKDNEYQIKNIQVSTHETKFVLAHKGIDLEEFILHVSGEHNVLNATAAIIVGISAGLSIDDIQMYMQIFRGSKRRLEYRGDSRQGYVLYDDYGHHPTEIKASLKALKSMFPNFHLVCIFQPHTASRTKALFESFAQAFSQADEVILMDIFTSAREETDPTVSSELLAEAIHKAGKKVKYEANMADVVKYINHQKYPSKTLIVTMGAGDVYKLIEEI